MLVDFVGSTALDNALAVYISLPAGVHHIHCVRVDSSFFGFSVDSHWVAYGQYQHWLPILTQTGGIVHTHVLCWVVLFQFLSLSVMCMQSGASHHASAVEQLQAHSVMPLMTSWWVSLVPLWAAPSDHSMTSHTHESTPIQLSSQLAVSRASSFRRGWVSTVPSSLSLH